MQSNKVNFFYRFFEEKEGGSLLKVSEVSDGRLPRSLIETILKNAKFVIENGIASNKKSAFTSIYNILSREGDPTSEHFMAYLEAVLNGGDGRRSLKLVNWLHIGKFAEGWLVKIFSWYERFFCFMIDKAPEKLSQLIYRLHVMPIRFFMLGYSKKFIYCPSVSKVLNSHNKDKNTYCFDILGEMTTSSHQAKSYSDDNLLLMDLLFKNNGSRQKRIGHKLAIKLSALYTGREEKGRLDSGEFFNQVEPLAIRLLSKSKETKTVLILDAEDSFYVDLTTSIFEKTFLNKEFCHSDIGYGLAVQAYRKDALDRLVNLKKISQLKGEPILVRLVKGAYWEQEVEMASSKGVSSPVFMSKEDTDLSYLLCACYLMINKKNFKVQYATHNPFTAISIMELAQVFDDNDYELHRLQGVAAGLCRNLKKLYSSFCGYNIYAPIGSARASSAYFLRRINELGNKNSFISYEFGKKFSTEEMLINNRRVLERLASALQDKINFMTNDGCK